MKRKSRKSKKLKKFLQSDEWKLLRAQALARDENRCFLCGSTEKICVHHLRYRKFNKEIQGELLNLITLCVKCHFAVHKNSRNIDLIEKLRLERPDQFEFVMKNP